MSYSNQVRIIAGRWKRTPLRLVDPSIRPTLSRVRHTLFSWLEHFMGGDWSRLKVLDLFAGSGALGLEAASRGAGQVVLVEALRPMVKALDQVKVRLQADNVMVVEDLAARWLSRKGGRFDLVFVDPPFDKKLYPELLPVLPQCLGAGGFLYCEHNGQLDFSGLPGLELLRHSRVGEVFFYLLQKPVEQGGDIYGYSGLPRNV